jgi:hypothetical protein
MNSASSSSAIAAPATPPRTPRATSPCAAAARSPKTPPAPVEKVAKPVRAAAAPATPPRVLVRTMGGDVVVEVSPGKKIVADIFDSIYNDTKQKNTIKDPEMTQKVRILDSDGHEYKIGDQAPNTLNKKTELTAVITKQEVKLPENPSKLSQEEKDARNLSISLNPHKEGARNTYKAAIDLHEKCHIFSKLREALLNEIHNHAEIMVAIKDKLQSKDNLVALIEAMSNKEKNLETNLEHTEKYLEGLANQLNHIHQNVLQKFQHFSQLNKGYLNLGPDQQLLLESRDFPRTLDQILNYINEVLTITQIHFE